MAEKETKPTVAKNPRSTEETEIRESRVLRGIKADQEVANEQLDGIMNSITSAKQELATVKADTKAEEARKATLSTELEKMESKVKQAEKVAKKAIDDAKEKTDEVVKQSEEYADLSEEIETMQETKKTLLDEAKKEAKALVEKAKDEVKALKGGVSDIEKRVVELETEEDELKTTIQALTDEAKKLERQDVTLQGEIAAAKEAKETAETELTEVEDRVKSGKATEAKLKTNRDTLQKEVKELDTERVAIVKAIEAATEDEKKAKKSLEETNEQKIAQANYKKHLIQQEAYIEKQFKEAGIPYTAFNPE